MPRNTVLIITSPMTVFAMCLLSLSPYIHRPQTTMLLTRSGVCPLRIYSFILRRAASLLFRHRYYRHAEAIKHFYHIGPRLIGLAIGHDPKMAALVIPVPRLNVAAK